MSLQMFLVYYNSLGGCLCSICCFSIAIRVMLFGHNDGFFGVSPLKVYSNNIYHTFFGLI